MNTRIVGQGTVEDHGVDTILVPLPLRGDDEDGHDQGGVAHPFRALFAKGEAFLSTTQKRDIKVVPHA